MFSPELNNRIYDILVQEAGASEHYRIDFLYSFPCNEFRFMGNIGFGGKIRFSHRGGLCPVFIDCYREDENEETFAIIERTNKQLAGVFEGMTYLQIRALEQ